MKKEERERAIDIDDFNELRDSNGGAEDLPAGQEVDDVGSPDDSDEDGDTGASFMDSIMDSLLDDEDAQGQSRGANAKAPRVLPTAAATPPKQMARSSGSGSRVGESPRTGNTGSSNFTEDIKIRPKFKGLQAEEICETIGWKPVRQDWGKLLLNFRPATSWGPCSPAASWRHTPSMSWT